ncbi:MAG: T9SS type A sorting domain-containing protein [Flavobacteriales bacterium]|nr:T9SS type A sorting domain-containing protein [Flavobacteriales bacterium]
MNRFYLLLLVFLFFYKNGKCQIVDDVEWSPQGATWLYEIISMSSLQHLVVSYNRDTTIYQRECKLFTSRIKTYIPNQNQINVLSSDIAGEDFIFCKQQDTIYWFNPQTLSFTNLYVFDILPGDMYEVEPNNFTFICNPILQPNFMVASDTGWQTNSNRKFRFVDFHQPPYWTVGNRVLKNIGSLWNFLPQPSSLNCNVVDGMVGATGLLRCYYDNIRGTVNFNSSSEDQCNLYMFSTFSINQNDLESLLYVYPNPAADFISIKIANNYIIRNLKIYDLSGRFLSGFTGNSNTFYVGDLIFGMYVLYVELDNGKVLTTKFVKK